MRSQLASTGGSALIDCLRKRILLFVAKSRLSLLIATLTALSTPSLASAQSVVAVLDSSKCTSGTDKTMGNYILGSGLYELTPKDGAQVAGQKITAELQYLSGGVWTSWAPTPAVQQATANNGVWSGPMWTNLAPGFGYRVKVVMTWQQNLGGGWQPNSQENAVFQKSF